MTLLTGVLGVRPGTLFRDALVSHRDIPCVELSSVCGQGAMRRGTSVFLFTHNMSGAIGREMEF